MNPETPTKDSSRVLYPRLLNETAWQFRRYDLDPSKVLVLVNGQNWLFNAAELMAQIAAVADVNDK